MRREIHLTGSEITILKAIGVTGAPLFGKLLLGRLGEIDEGEFLETLTSLMDMDYVVASKANVAKIADVERSFFRVNSIYASDLREAMRPGFRRDDDKARRRRRG